MASRQDVDRTAESPGASSSVRGDIQEEVGRLLEALVLMVALLELLLELLVVIIWVLFAHSEDRI